MTMAYIWTGMIVVSLLCSLYTGQSQALAAAAMDGAVQAVSLCISICGPMCLWMGVMEIMKRSGMAQGLTGMLKPLLRRLYPAHETDDAVLGDIAANVSANLLGLGNAATPLGIRATKRMSRGEQASDDMIMLIVCNTASIQLLPTTVASVRAAAGAAQPFDILPAVWLASLISLAVGILAARSLARIWRRRGR